MTAVEDFFCQDFDLVYMLLVALKLFLKFLDINIMSKIANKITISYYRDKHTEHKC